MASYLQYLDVHHAIVPDPLVVRQGDPLGEIMAAMGQDGTPIADPKETERSPEMAVIATIHHRARKSCVIICDDHQQVQGILTEQDVVRLGLEYATFEGLTVGQVMTSPVVTVERSQCEDFFQLCTIFQNHRIRHLPIVDSQGQLVGLLTNRTLQQVFCPLNFLRMREVGEIMKTPAMSAPGQTPLTEIAKIMLDYKVGSIIIGENTHGTTKPLGLITERDLLQHRIHHGSLQDYTAQEIMSHPVVTARPQHTLEQVQELMKIHGLSRLVVVDHGGGLQGIITRSDLLQSIKPMELLPMLHTLNQQVTQLETEKYELLSQKQQQLESYLHKKQRQENLLRQITQHIHQSLDIQQILENTVGELQTLLECDRTLVYRFDGEGTSGKFVAESLGADVPSALGHTVEDHCFFTQGDRLDPSQGVMVSHDIHHQGYGDCHIKFLGRYGVQSSLVVGLYVQGQPWGLLIAHQCHRAQPWSQSQQDFFQEIATHLSIAIQQGTIHHQLQHQLEEKLQLQQQLYHSEQLYSQLAKTVPVGLFRLNEQGQCLSHNQKFLEITGLTPETLGKEGFLGMVHPEDFPIVQEKLGHFFRNHEPREVLTLVFRMLNAYQTVIWVNFELQVELDETSDRPPHTYVGHISDITEEKQANQALRTTTQQYRHAQRIAKIGNWELNHQTGKLYWSEQVYKIFGMKPDPSPRTYEDFAHRVHPGDRALVDKTFKRHLRDQVPYNITHRIQGEREGEVYVQEQCETLFNDQGQPLISRGTVQDITTIRKTQLALRQLNQELEKKVEERTQQVYREQQNLQYFLDNANDLIHSVAMDTGEFVYVNQAWRRVLGYGSEDLENLTIYDILTPDSEQVYLEWLERVAQNQCTAMENMELIFFGRENQEIIVEGNVTITEEGEKTPLVRAIFHDITDHKRTERENRLLRERFEFLLGSSPAIIYSMSVNGDYPLTFVSKNVEPILGYAPQTFINDRNFWASKVHPDDMSLVFSKQLSIFQEPTQSYEYRFLRQDGSYVWLLNEVRLIYGDQGQPQEIIGYWADISDRKQIEEELNQSELKFQKLIDDIGNDFMVFSYTYPDNLVEYVSKGVTKLFDLPQEAMVKQPWHDVIPWLPDALDSFRDFNQAFESGQESGQFEARYKNRHGDVCTLLVSEHPVRDRQGQVIKIEGLAEDITQRKNIELERQNLILELSYFKLALDRSALVSMSDPEGNITYGNQSFYEVSGYSPEEVIGQNHRILNSGYHPPEFFREMWNTITSGRVWRGEIRNRSKGGTKYWVESTIVPFLDNQGKITKYLAIRFDITSRKESALRLKESNDLLRIIGLAQSQFISAENRLTIFDDLLGNLLKLTQSDYGLVCEVRPGGFPGEDLVLGESFSKYQEQATIQTSPSRHKHFRTASAIALKNLVPHALACFYAIEPWLEQVITGGKTVIRNQQSLVVPTTENHIQCPSQVRSFLAMPCYSGDQLVAVVAITNRRGGYDDRLESYLYPFLNTCGNLVEGYRLQRKQEEASRARELAEREMKKQLATIEAAVDGIAILQDGCYQYLNKAHVAMFGFQGADELLNKHWSYLYGPEERERFEKIVFPFLEKERYWQGEATARRQDGSPFVEELSLTITEDDLLICVCRDVSERKLAEQKLQQQAKQESLVAYITQRMRLSTNLHDILDAVVQELRKVLNSDRVLVYRLFPEGFGVTISESVNPQFPSLLKQTFPHSLFSDGDPPPYPHHKTLVVKDIRQDSLKSSPELVQFLENIGVKSLLMMPIVQKNELWGLLMIHHNSHTWDWRLWETNLVKQVASQLAIAIQQTQLFEQLEKELRERKNAQQQLTERNQQLAISNDELARATRLKDEFLANMSHELRTPLNAILGMSEGLSEQVFGTINDRQLKALRTIERSGSHLLELINDILDVAKIESGKLELDLGPADIAPLCRASMTFIQQQCQTKGIQLELSIPPHLPTLTLDERRIRQVLINLLNNAVKFTERGGKIFLKVECCTLPEPPPNPPAEVKHFIQFSVIDTGIGIPLDKQKQLFQPFVQVDSALNRKYEGTGLGLALVKRIVELHGGKIALESEPNVGSCFHFYLPYVRGKAEPVANAEDSHFTSIAIVEESKTSTILLAEDNEANIITISSYLKAKGYEVLVANNGLEALDYIESEYEHIDIVLMDIQMPEMDGFEAIDKIRNHPNPAIAQLPILALTALAMKGDRERCLEAGANNYLSKPIKLKELISTIQAMTH